MSTSKNPSVPTEETTLEAPVGPIATDAEPNAETSVDTSASSNPWTNADANTDTSADTETATIRAALEDVAAILPGWLETVRARTRGSGMQAAIWFDGELLTEIAVGEADMSAGITLLPTHRLRIASHSKMFAALAIMRLREKGLLRLDDTLGERVPDLADTPVADRTLRDLLSHSAGISRDSSDSRWWQHGKPFPTREELLEIARTDAVKAEAGVHLQYSNIGYGLLGLVIEEVTGLSFEQAVTELVLEPVGVPEIGPDLPEGFDGPKATHGFALGHTAALFGPRRPVEQIHTGALAAATGFWANAGSIASFAGRVFTEGALLEAGSLREMRRRVWSVADGAHYGLGLQEGPVAGFQAIGHSGGFPTGLSRTWAVPDKKLAVSVIGTSVDAPSSEVATGLLHLIGLALGRPVPEAERWEGAAALGGGGDGRERPAPLSEQPGVELHGQTLSAREVADLVAGIYDSPWGRSRLARIGDRLFELNDSAFNPTDGAAELAVHDTAADPMCEGGTVVLLTTWGDVGYGSWAEPMAARIESGPQGRLECTGVMSTGKLMVPTERFELPERIVAP